MGLNVSPPAWMRDRFPAWSKRAADAHREHTTPCPKCRSTSIMRFMHHPGSYACFDCRHHWTEHDDIVSAYVPNPEAS